MALATVSQADLRKRVVEAMEDELRVTDKVAKDFVASLIAVCEESLEKGEKVSLFGIVILNPSFRLAKPRRKGVDPRSGEEKMIDATPAKIAVRASVSKKMKDALPSTTSAVGKNLRAEAEERKAAAEKRAAAREREERKAAKGGKK
jgi:nucleoid DNA-binding protein